jgi:hypothetical protein
VRSIHGPAFSPNHLDHLTLDLNEHVVEDAEKAMSNRHQEKSESTLECGWSQALFIAQAGKEDFGSANNAPVRSYRLKPKMSP